MKKILTIGTALMIGLLWALPAMADVDVYANINKDKDVRVIEYIDIEKWVDVLVLVDVEPAGAAEALAILNQAIDGISGSWTDVTRTSTLTGSVLGNVGIVGVNQNTGDGSNQANAVALAVVELEAFTDAQASAEQRNTNNSVTIFDVTYTDLITGSINGNLGIVGVNQSAGNMNNQGNAVALAAGLEGVLVALAEADLGQLNSGNTVDDVVSTKTDTIIASINGNHGIVGVNQSSGSMNSQANIVAVSFAH